MKKVSYFLSLAMIVIGLSGNYSVSAQGRGHKNGHDRNNNGQRDNGNRDRGNDRKENDNDNGGNDHDKNDHDRGRHNDGRGNANSDRGNNGNHYGHRKGDNRWDYDNNHRDHNWERRTVNHYYHTHDRYCGHTVVVHNYARPRYIYYRDYDVYYDCNRSVYISYSGRSWTVSAALPFPMRHINVRSANRFEVDYWDDNLQVYLERRRPTCDRIYVGG
jgi:hypothetical protein